MEIEDKRKAYNNKYYQKNKEAILTKIKEKQPCEFCKKLITVPNMYRHQKSSACINPCKVSRKGKLVELQNKIAELQKLILKEN